MVTYRELTEAKAVLELPERVSLREIRVSYINLLKRRHPDTCVEDRQRIISASRKVCAYCDNYE